MDKLREAYKKYDKAADDVQLATDVKAPESMRVGLEQELNIRRQEFDQLCFDYVMGLFNDVFEDRLGELEGRVSDLETSVHENPEPIGKA